MSSLKIANLCPNFGSFNRPVGGNLGSYQVVHFEATDRGFPKLLLARQTAQNYVREAK